MVSPISPTLGPQHHGDLRHLLSLHNWFCSLLTGPYNQSTPTQPCRNWHAEPTLLEEWVGRKELSATLTPRAAVLETPLQRHHTVPRKRRALKIAKLKESLAIARE